MKERQKELKEIVKKSVEKDMSRFDNLKPLTDEEMKSSGHDLPPEDMLERIKSKIKDAQKDKKGEF